jgi:hypothetical protein
LVDGTDGQLPRVYRPHERNFDGNLLTYRRI